ncbi:hypothetical protein [Granulicella sp. dw_53]|uniref:hypothetical protein n=1 Tax=Granulicella sp. dw_53 TaxID=2719792 RepID=UPI001BD2DECD|nr:hypothetical protein [Granulicella sp. dw_53]
MTMFAANRGDLLRVVARVKKVKPSPLLHIDGTEDLMRDGTAAAEAGQSLVTEGVQGIEMLMHQGDELQAVEGFRGVRWDDRRWGFALTREVSEAGDAEPG